MQGIKFSIINILIISVALAAIAAPSVYARSVRSLGQPKGYISDYANLLSMADFSQLTRICEDLEAANTTEMAIVIIDSTDGETIESYAQELFTNWGIGKEDADNGILILVALDDHKWRVHTGYGVEHVLTDTLAGRIMEHEAVPEFRNGNYGAGLINAATEISKVMDGEEYTNDQVDLRFLLSIPIIGSIIGTLIWLAIRVKCPRCGSRVHLKSDKAVLDASYSHSGIRKMDYECTVCHNDFSRMSVIPLLVHSTSSGSSSSGGWKSSGWKSSSGGSSFGGFGGGSSGGGGASGGW